MAENRSSLINAGPQLNAGLKKTPGQNCQVLNKRRGRLIDKIQYINSFKNYFEAVMSEPFVHKGEILSCHNSKSTCRPTEL